MEKSLQISDSEVEIMRIIWNNGGNAKYLVSSLLKQDFINSNDMEELKKFWEEGADIDE